MLYTIRRHRNLATGIEITIENEEGDTVLTNFYYFDSDVRTSSRWIYDKENGTVTRIYKNYYNTFVKPDGDDTSNIEINDEDEKKDEILECLKSVKSVYSSIEVRDLDTDDLLKEEHYNNGVLKKDMSFTVTKEEDENGMIILTKTFYDGHVISDKIQVDVKDDKVYELLDDDNEPYETIERDELGRVIHAENDNYEALWIYMDPDDDRFSIYKCYDKYEDSVYLEENDYKNRVCHTQNIDSDDVVTLDKTTFFNEDYLVETTIEISTYTVYKRDESGDINPDSRTDKYESIYEYDEKNNLINKSTISNDTDLIEEYIKYDDKNRQISHEYYHKGKDDEKPTLDENRSYYCKYIGDTFVLSKRANGTINYSLEAVAYREVEDDKLDEFFESFNNNFAL